MPPVTAVMRRVRRDVEAAFSADNSRDMSEGSTFSNLREVIMTVSEYEERFSALVHEAVEREGLYVEFIIEASRA
jgi:hypothetical protein